MKVTYIETFGVKNIPNIIYCPKCEHFESHMPPISVFRGKALRGIDKTTGEFRLRIESPKDWSKKEIIVKTFPQYIITKLSEWRSSGRRVYKTKERAKRVYPQLKRNDEVIVAGFMTEGAPSISVIMKNLTIGVSSQFVADKVQLKKGFLKSFSIGNPILVEAEKMIEKTMKEK